MKLSQHFNLQALGFLRRFAIAPYHKKAQQLSSKGPRTSNILNEMALTEIDSVLQQLATQQEGLRESDVQARIKQYGLNEIAREKRRPWYIQLLFCFKTPFNLLLITIAAVSYYTHNPSSTIIISVMILVSVFLRFTQEFRSSKAAEELQALVSTMVTVFRLPEVPEERPTQMEIPIKNLVPGDILHLSSGDMVPGDVRLISARDLLVSEASLTGEAMPVEKDSAPIRVVPKNQLALPNTCFMGTSIISGTATGVVVLTGERTYFGALAKSIVGEKEETSFDKGITALSWLLIRFIVVMISIIFLINGITKGNWLEAFMFALSVAVGLTPEMLPMIVTTNLAKGALAMSKHKVIVKRLDAIQNLGAMDILCTDKTGTLTQNKVILDKHLNIHGEEEQKVLAFAYLNSFYQTGLKNLLDDAVLKHAAMDKIADKLGEYSKIDEVPFDFVRRRMSVVVEKNKVSHLLICKGALEEIFKVCTLVEDSGKIYPLEDKLRENIRQIAQELNEDGFRVIALAYKELSLGQTHYSAEDEKDLTLLGYISFLDPPKETASSAIAALEQQGIKVKILTGDNEAVTRKVCRDVGLKMTQVVQGDEMDSLSGAALDAMVDKANVFTRLTPRHKEILIESLKRKGHVVGFLGDGINDTAALKSADVGISVESAVDIAKESADIILLEKSLLVLSKGVLEGRQVFGTIIKYIRMTTSSNFGNVFSMVGASALLPFLPMQPVQILIQNLLYDFSQIAIPIDTVDEDYVDQPRQWQIGNISRFMLFFGPISSIFDYVTFGVLWFIFGANSVAGKSLFQSGWFVEGLLSQTLIIHMIRTAKIPFVESWAAPPLIILTVCIMAIGVYIPFSPIAPFIGLRPLPLHYFLWLAAILMGYCVLTQVVKRWFIRKFGYN